jgi:hypothetical protein
MRACGRGHRRSPLDRNAGDDRPAGPCQASTHPSIAVLPIVAQAAWPSALSRRAAPGSARGDAILPITDCLHPHCQAESLPPPSPPSRIPAALPRAGQRACGRAGPPTIQLDRSTGGERPRPSGELPSSTLPSRIPTAAIAAKLHPCRPPHERARGRGCERSRSTGMQAICALAKPFRAAFQAGSGDAEPRSSPGADGEKWKMLAIFRNPYSLTGSSTYHGRSRGKEDITRSRG